MKEKIYTSCNWSVWQDCECPLCLSHSKLENDYTDYYLGPALMEPDSRIDTNKKGFCRRHFELLYNRQENRLGLALETHTHLNEKLSQIKEISRDIIKTTNIKRNSDSVLSPWRRLAREEVRFSPHIKLLSCWWSGQQLHICGPVWSITMGRYLDVHLLWSKRQDFSSNSILREVYVFV